MNRLGELAIAEPSRRPSLVEDAYRALKTAIRDNVFPAGYQGSEQEIAVRLGMSRTPVHEAIIRLQEEGLVRVLSKRGVMVCPLSPEDMREVYDIVIALEAAAAELLAGLPKDERRVVVVALEGINAEMEAALRKDDLDAWARADERFHQALVEGCGNRRIARIAQTVMDQSHRARVLTLRLRAKPMPSAKEHRQIVDAIRRGDASAALTHARDHRRRARDELLPLLADLGMKYL
jgi:DNA-binding GntR family transcriptional regulator